MPRHAREEDRRARDHVRRQHRDRRAVRGRPERRPGGAVPALPDLQPRRRDRGPVPDRARPRRDAEPDQRARQRLLGPASGDPGHLRGDAQQGGHPRGLREGERRRLRGPRPDEPARAQPDGRGRVVLPRRADDHEERPREGGHPGARAQGPRRPRRHQRLEPDHGHGVPAAARRRTVDQAGGDRGLDDARGAAREHAPVPGEAARAARLPRRADQRREPAQGHGGLGPLDRQGEGQGAGRLFHALDARR